MPPLTDPPVVGADEELVTHYDDAGNATYEVRAKDPAIEQAQQAAEAADASLLAYLDMDVQGNPAGEALQAVVLRTPGLRPRLAGGSG